MGIKFTLDEIEERDIEVAAKPGRDDISVCQCTGFCLREAERNACPCHSAQQFCTSSCHRVRGTVRGTTTIYSVCMKTRCVLQEHHSENEDRGISLLFSYAELTFHDFFFLSQRQQ